RRVSSQHLLIKKVINEERETQFLCSETLRHSFCTHVTNLLVELLKNNKKQII
ncbi:unnamed protein product, partial [Arabidopsis halleri]